MIRNALIKYLEAECKALTEAHDKLLHQPRNQAAVHEQRTGVKKLRAFFALTDNIPDLKFKHGRYLNKLRALQAIAGVARDAQLQSRALRRYELLNKWRFGYAHLLLQERQEVAAQLLTTASKRLKPGSLAELPALFTEKIQRVGEADLQQILLHYVETSFNAVHSPGARAGHAAWHEVRKQLKAVYYQLTILKDVTTAPKYQQMLAFSKKAGELLGNWHDSSELHRFIQGVIRKAKQQSLPVPVKAIRLLKDLRQETQEQLALCAVHLHNKQQY